jgi:hypothetical protein
MMISSKLAGYVLFALILPLAGAGTAEAQSAAPAGNRKAAQSAAGDSRPKLEPKAIELLKATSTRLAAAHSMSFTSVDTYESPSRLGIPLAYTTKSDVVLQRPDKLRVITSGDGPASEFYYDGKIMMAYEPAEDLVAIGPAPPTIDETMEVAYHVAAIYFPFDDVIVSDPYKDIAQDLRLAFYIGQSNVVGGTTTDIVAYDAGGVLIQIWIGTEDKLPRMVRAVYLDDPLFLRHQLELSNWQINPAVSADFFGSARAKSGKRINFARPDAPLPGDAKPKAASSSGSN